jgi:predicted NBD/HSP70 family sugar kinase
MEGLRMSRPGTPRLLRELNDRAALELLLTEGPLTRAQLGEHTGLSKVTASQMLTRLQERGLVQVAGEQAGGRGPNAAVYAVVPSSAYVAGLHIESDVVSAGVADVTGHVVTEVTVDPNGGDDPVQLVRNTLAAACRSAGVELSQLRASVIGSPGVVDPRTGDPRLAVNLPAWHEGVLDALRADLGRPVTIENDVNLAAIAERSDGAAVDVSNFVFIWLGVGVGLATVLGGRLHRGFTGAAGEIGYLPVPGVPLPEDVWRPYTGSLQSLVGAAAVRQLAEREGFGHRQAGQSVRAAVAALDAGDEHGVAFVDELARRVALGLAAVCAVLDPQLVVLGGVVGHAGGVPLAERVAARVSKICLSNPQVVATGVAEGPVLRGAMLTALEQARKELLDSVATGP